MICRHSTQFSRFVYTILLLPLPFVIFDLYLYIYMLLKLPNELSLVFVLELLA